MGLHIFIDESGTFVCDARKRHSISAVGALVIPTSSMKGFENPYGRLRQQLPQDKGEVKGRQLSEDQVVEVAALLRKVGALFEVVAIDVGMHSEEELLLHKASQEEALELRFLARSGPTICRHLPVDATACEQLRAPYFGLPARRFMSVIGYKQTFRWPETMSAIPPTADIEGAKLNVRS